MEWKEVRLGDYVKILSGYAYKGKYLEEDGENVLLGMGCVSFKDKFLYKGARGYSEDAPNRFCVEHGDLVLATRQQSDNLPILGMPAKIPNDINAKKIIFGANLYKVENKSDISNDFLFWQLKSSDYVDYIRSVQTGTTVRMITKGNVENYTFKCPDKKSRDKIVSILSSLDSKIETNNKINAKLEEMAQDLFKSWFVDFEPFKDKGMVESELGMIPEGWRVGKLEDIAIITMGQSPSGKSYNEEGNGTVFYQGRTEFGFRFPSIRLYTTEPKRYAEPLSTLLSVRAPVGDINMATTKCCIGRGVASIMSKDECNSYIYYQMDALKPYFDMYNGEGTVFGSINKDSLNGMAIIIPPMQIMKAFEDKAKAIDDKMLSCFNENLRLSQLRDTLLPKLMSGEIEL